jgi:DNA polymerase-3 subunit epsilon
VRALAELDVLIVDCQTTGASPAFGVVLELAWGVARANRESIAGLESHFIALPAGHVVPEQVIRLTGYDPNRDAARAIADEEAWQRLRRTVAHARGAPTAIHYARFELAFLREWAASLEPTAEFPLDAVCVHALARRLYPDLPRQSLRALAGFLGHGLDLTRSSLGHVEATAFVWRKLCAELAGRGIETWEALREFLATRGPPLKKPKKPKYPILPARYKSLPNEPGVYRFLRSNGDVLYVGKASSLSKRTASHFSARRGKQLAPEMLTQVSDIQAEVVASALEAALLEHETITRLRPPYNVQLVTADPRVWYSARDFESASAIPDEAHQIGPLPSEYSLRALAAQIALAGGAEQSARLRSWAVGVSDLWLPDEAVFRAGWLELTRRHAELASNIPSPRKRVLALAKRLLLERALRGTEDDAAAADAKDEREKSTAWDPERVARHLERAAVQAYQVYRRAAWLRLLQNSDIVYREPTSTRLRLLRVRNGRLSEALDAPATRTPGLAVEGVRLHGAAASNAFDRETYDRLRILSTELKRIQRDGGIVAVYWAASRLLPAALQAGIQRLV